jgi:hypothetical protein
MLWVFFPRVVEAEVLAPRVSALLFLGIDPPWGRIPQLDIRREYVYKALIHNNI